MKINKSRIRQGINFILSRFILPTPKSWIYIYGHNRGGTSYLLRQFMKISRRGTGDWMLFQFATAFSEAKNRERQTMDIDKLESAFKKNLLRNALWGSGSQFDIVIKQAKGRKIELEFFTKLFRRPPDLVLFAYREPHGWWATSKIKFGRTDEFMIERYESAFETYQELGGIPIQYGDELVTYLQKSPLFNGIEVENFSPKSLTIVEEAKILETSFNRFEEYRKEKGI